MQTTTKRRRRTKVQIERLERQILDVLTGDHPQSVRHVFYRMTNPTLAEPVEKSEAGYRHVQQRILAMRRSGAIPYGWISDATRRGFHVSTFDGAGDFIEAFAGLYRAPLWDERTPHVEVWCESRSLAGVLQATCEALAVSLYPAGGFSSATLCYEAACEIDRKGRNRAVVLYVGDYDQSGVLIDQAVERELRSHLTTPLEFKRIGISPWQITYYGLPTRPPKATDKRRPDIKRVVEGEAMPANIMRRIVREAVEHYLPAGALAATKAAEESEREGLRRLARYIDRKGLDFMNGRRFDASAPF